MLTLIKNVNQFNQQSQCDSNFIKKKKKNF